MIIEERDPVSGAIRFKEDEDTKNLKKLVRLVEDLKGTVSDLKRRVEELESNKKDST